VQAVQKGLAQRERAIELTTCSRNVITFSSTRFVVMSKSNISIAAVLALICSVFAAGCTPASDRRSLLEDRATVLLSEEQETFAPAVEGLRLDHAADLAKALHAALMRDHRLIAAQEDAKAAAAVVAGREASSRPNVTASGQVGGRSGADGIMMLGLIVQAEQILSDGGAQSSEIDAAVAGLLLAQARTEQIENAIALEALEAIVAVWRAEEQRRLSHLRLARLAALQEQVIRSVAAGLLEGDALERLDRTTLSAQTDAAHLSAARSIAEANFQRSFGRPPERSGAFPAELIVNVPELHPGGRLPETPTLRAAAAEVIVAEANARRALAAMSPQVSLQATARPPSDPGGVPNFGLGIGLRYTFSDGGQREADIAATTARKNAAVAQLRAAQQGTRASITAAEASLRASEHLLELSQAIEQGIKEEQRLSAMRSATGDRDIVAQVELEMLGYSAAEQVISSRADLYIARARLAADLGLLISSLLEHAPMGT
jgi:outer membrane protein TolC